MQGKISLFYTCIFSLGYPIGAPVNNLNMCCYEDFLPWNNNFMLKSGANIFVSQILVEGRCDEV